MSLDIDSFGNYVTFSAPKAAVEKKRLFSATVSSFVKVSKNGILLIGQSDRSVNIDIPESNPVGALRIPVGLQSRVLDIPAEEITNQTVDITGQFADMVKNREDIRSVATAVIGWISGRDKISFQNKLILDILSSPEKYLGSSIKKVAEDSGYSSRHLRRLFLIYTGFSTKDYFEVLRFEYAKRLIAEPRYSKTEAQRRILDYYYDQSHFIKSFKRFSGITPYQFMKKMSDFYDYFSLDDAKKSPYIQRRIYEVLETNS